VKCHLNDCAADAVWRVVEVRNRAMIRGEDAFCDMHTRAKWESYTREAREGVGCLFRKPGALSFELELIVADYRGQPAKVLLREVDGQRLFSVPISFVEVSALYYAAKGSSYNDTALPLAMKRLADDLGATLDYVIVDQRNAAGYLEANAIFQHAGRTLGSRIRPADGLALALLSKVPFMVAEEVLLQSPDCHNF
jgi:bifunctional DNase/RNase